MGGSGETVRVNDRIYSELAEAYDRSSATGPPNALYDRPTILRLLGPLAGRDVLELGCAGGHLTQRLVDGGAAVLAVDKSEEMVRVARQRLAGRATVEAADLEEPLCMVDDTSVDLVVASLVLHYLADWGPLLAEAHRCLRPGGTIVVSIHHPINGWLLSEQDNYHRTELIEEAWQVGGVSVAARMWRRPISAVFTPLLEAGFIIDAVVEPEPDLDESAVPDDRMRTALNTRPVFLYVRARRVA